jgi:hypothetical protein
VSPVAATPAIPAGSSVTERPISSPAPQAAAAPPVKADAKGEPKSESNADAKTEPQAATANPPPVAVVAPLTLAAPAEKPGAIAAAEAAPAPLSSARPGDFNPPATPVTLMPAKSLMAPPDPAAAKLIEPEPRPDAVKAAPMPETVAAAPPSEDDAAPDAAPTERPNVAVQRTEFGADVGGANSLNGLRALWRGLVKSNKELADLRPIVVVKESNNGPGMQLRLVAGPLGDAAAAANICARLMESHKPCQTTVFDGQSLAMKADEPPAKPEVRSRNAAKRAAAEEPAKKPEFSASSWLFGKH